MAVDKHCKGVVSTEQKWWICGTDTDAEISISISVARQAFIDAYASISPAQVIR